MSSFQPANSDVTPALHDHWGLFLAEGAILILLGLAAIAMAFIAGNVSIVFLGWLFIIAGLVGLLSTFRGRAAPGFGWSLLSAIVALLAGLILIGNPLQSLVALPHNVVTLAHVLIGFFIIDGILMIVLALTHRREFSAKWEWLLANGIVDLVLAGLLLAGLPGSVLWALALLVGIDKIFGGASLVAMALEARKSAATGH